MTAYTTIVIKHGDEAAATISDRFVRVAADKLEAGSRLQAFLSGLFSGSYQGRLSLKVDSVTVGDRASATATCASCVNTDNLVIGDVTITVATSPSGESQIAVGGTDTAQATLFAAAINAHSQLKGLVTATSAAAVVTITSALPGRIGEMITLSENASTITLSAAALGGITATSTAIVRDHGFGVA